MKFLRYSILKYGEVIWMEKEASYWRRGLSSLCVGLRLIFARWRNLLSKLSFYQELRTETKFPFRMNLIK
eukprot:scaffold1804_cov263-Pinguiococcus_pyrenoidosus.AAC.21